MTKSRLVVAGLLLALSLTVVSALFADTTYTVQRGDNLYRIAIRFNTSVAAIVAANNIVNPSRIYAGQVLIIPGDGGSAPAPAPSSTPQAEPGGMLTYVVQRGDRLSSIAVRFGTTVSAIVAANGIANPNLIYAGQELKIPVATAEGSAPADSPPAGNPPGGGPPGGLPPGQQTQTAQASPPPETSTPEPPATTVTPEPPTPTPAPDVSPTPPPAPPPPTTGGIWLNAGEIAGLAQSGAAWENVYLWAQQSTSAPHLNDQDDNTDAAVMAKALLYVRTGEPAYREAVVNAIMAAVGTEDGGKTLPLARNLTAYIVAADLVGLDGPEDATFRAWLSAVRYEDLDGRTLISTHEDRPNNWGTHAGAARIAAALYLGDTNDLQQAAKVFEGYLGNRNVYAGFEYGEDLSWQCNPAAPVGANPTGCLIGGYPVDGVLPDDQRRAGSFTWPPPKENYVWEALQGAVAQAWMLNRAGYPAFSWENQAILRAVSWLHNQAGFPAEGDDTGTPWLVNHVYGSNFPTSAARPGKNGLGFYDWYFN
jgi:LysM repeat protein